MMYSNHIGEKLSSRIFGVAISQALIALILLIAPSTSRAQTQTLFGSLSNFDVLNDTGQKTYGFEIELDGLKSIGGAFAGNRYGAPTVIPFVGGVYVRYVSKWDPATQQFSTFTPVATNLTSTNGHQCVIGTAGYQTSGCEHFGVALPYYGGQPTRTVYRWLIADPQTPGAVTPLGTNVSIGAPVWTLQPGGVPVVGAEIQAPEPQRPELQFGDAQWVKLFKLELPREVGLDELVTDNAAVPQNAAQTEVEWKLIQHNPHSANSGTLRNQGGIGGNSHAVVRRYEFYKYTGKYDPQTHEAICGGDASCNAPLNGELGNYIGAQMAAANIGVPTVATTVSAANFNGANLASEEIVAAFGSNLATTTGVAAVNPLPTSIAGTVVIVKDKAGVERSAPLFFVSPGQVNYQIPSGTAVGNATITVNSGDGHVATGTTSVATVAPGLFAANANGQGVAAAVALRIRNGAQSFEPIASFDGAKYISVPLDLGPNTDAVYLILYGTGLRFRSALQNVSVTVGGIVAQVDYAGPAPGFVGLDQLNVLVPRALAGRGEVDINLSVENKAANTIKVNIK